MMNFFKKKPDPYQELSDGFQNSFTIEQKAAIIGSLILIAKADGQVHRKELKYIERIATLKPRHGCSSDTDNFVEKGESVIVSVNFVNAHWPTKKRG